MASAAAAETDDDLLTIDELSSATGLTVRTTRYYSTLGLIPPPIRRGRVAYYDRVHRARLDLVRALQDHGFTLQAIGHYLEKVPADAGVEELALQRAMMTSWTTTPPERLSRRELEQRAGRRLSDQEVARLEGLTAVIRDGEEFLATPSLRVGVELLDLDIPPDSLDLATETIRRNVETRVEELSDILRTKVLEPFRREPHSPEDAQRMQETVDRLRQLTLEAVVATFQRAANDVISRSLREAD
jgi:DNA-binding transcriptional MerR regulator